MVCVEEGQQKSKYIIQGLRPQDVKRDEYFVGHAVRPDHVFLRLKLGLPRAAVLLHTSEPAMATRLCQR